MSSSDETHTAPPPRPPAMLRYGKVLGLLVLAKLYTILFLYLAFLRVDVDPHLRVFVFTESDETRKERVEEIQGSFFERLAPFDGQFYLDVSEKGYRTLFHSGPMGARVQSGNYAFFPLLPWILRATGRVGDAYQLPLALGLIWLAGVVALYLIWRLATRLSLPSTLAVAFALTYPSAIFQSVLYTEALFLCFTAAAILAAVNRRLLPAALFAALGGLLRPQGVLLGAFFFFELLWPRLRADRRPSGAALARLAVTASPLVGFLTLAAICFHVRGDPLAFVHVQSSWGRSVSSGGFLAAFWEIVGYDGPPLDLLGVAFALAILPVVWRRLPFPFFAYAVCLIAMPLSTGSILSMGRFLSVSIPHLLALAALVERWPKTAWTLCGVFFLAQSLAAIGLMAWGFIG